MAESIVFMISGVYARPGCSIRAAVRTRDEVREALDYKDRRTTDKYARRLVSGEIFDSLPVLEND